MSLVWISEYFGSTSMSSYIFRDCVPELFVSSYAVGFINIQGKLFFVSFITVQSYDVHK